MLNLQSVYLGSSSQPLEASDKTRISLDANGVVHVDRGGNVVTLHWDVRNAAVVKGEGYDAYVAEQTKAVFVPASESRATKR